jgi:hypothetical protein
VIIAVIPVGVVEVAGDQIVDVVAMGDGLMSAVGAVNVVGLVAIAVVLGRAAVWVGVAHRDRMLVHVVAVGVVEVTVMEVVEVPFVAHRGVPAACPMLVIVSLVESVLVHRCASAGLSCFHRR